MAETGWYSTSDACTCSHHWSPAFTYENKIYVLDEFCFNSKEECDRFIEEIILSTHLKESP